MKDWYSGTYWHYRELTLRQYADFVKGVLELLRAAHPVFHSLEWVGDGKRKPVALAPDLSNVDDLVYRYSWGKKKDIRGPRKSDGTPSSEATSVIGFGKVFNTGRSSKQGGITVSVSAGIPDGFTPNSVVISFPAPTEAAFPNQEFADYTFLLDLFKRIIRYTNPEKGLVNSLEYSNLIYGEGSQSSGWLTYFADPRCAELAKEFETEEIDFRGTLFTVGRGRMMIPPPPDAIEIGMRLRDRLKDLGVIK